MQVTTGLRAILTSPAVYSFFQNIMGARQGWVRIVQQYVKPISSDAMLDIGCGPGDVLEYLPDVKYWGFDVSDQYITEAQKKYGDRGSFQAKILTREDLAELPKFDIVLMSGVLHHLDDSDASDAISLAFMALKKGGRLVTVDPCFTSKQNPIAHFLISRDRGQNVRNKLGYQNLVQEPFQSIYIDVEHKSWIPYTHCYMVCTK